MSLHSRARRVGKALPLLGHQQIISDLARLRLYPKHDGLYIDAHREGYGERECMTCRGSYPVGIDRKGNWMTSASAEFCPACFEELGRTNCWRCEKAIPGTADFCDECEAYIESQ